MAKLFHVEKEPQYVCLDRSHYHTIEEQMVVMVESKTLYVGNLSFFTTEEQLHETFSLAGPVRRIIMGLNNFTKRPCGFCFVEYYTREHAEACLKYISGTICDGRVIRCDLDHGFKPGRQFGRGKSGGQVRDERRKGFDAGRGDFPKDEREIVSRSPGSGLGKRGRASEGGDRDGDPATRILHGLEHGLSSAREDPSKRRAVESDIVVTTNHLNEHNQDSRNLSDGGIEPEPESKPVSQDMQ